MSSSAHTSGPWHAELCNTDWYASINGAWLIRGPQDEYIARLTDEDEPREANARLIAKAPEMCAFIRDIAVWLIAPDLGPIARTEVQQQAHALLAEIDGSAS
jgi:hypothetical protein